MRSIYRHTYAALPPLSLMVICGITTLFLMHTDHPILGAMMLVATLVFACDAAARVGEYRAVLDHLNQPDWSRAFSQMSLMRRTWCQRHAAKAAGRHSGYPQFSVMYPEYRWYHILPDNTFTRRSPFLNVRWWFHLIAFWMPYPDHGRRS